MSTKVGKTEQKLLDSAKMSIIRFHYTRARENQAARKLITRGIIREAISADLYARNMDYSAFYRYFVVIR